MMMMMMMHAYTVVQYAYPLLSLATMNTYRPENCQALFLYPSPCLVPVSRSALVYWSTMIRP